MLRRDFFANIIGVTLGIILAFGSGYGLGKSKPVGAPSALPKANVGAASDQSARRGSSPSASSSVAGYDTQCPYSSYSRNSVSAIAVTPAAQGGAHRLYFVCAGTSVVQKVDAP